MEAVAVATYNFNFPRRPPADYNRPCPVLLVILPPSSLSQRQESTGQDNKHHRGYWDKTVILFKDVLLLKGVISSTWRLVILCWRQAAERVRLNLQQLLKRLFQRQQLSTFQA